MEKYNITYYCEYGKYELEECEKFPKQEDIEESIKTLFDIGLGKIKKIVIDKIV